VNTLTQPWIDAVRLGAGGGSFRLSLCAGHRIN